MKRSLPPEKGVLFFLVFFVISFQTIGNSYKKDPCNVMISLSSVTHVSCPDAFNGSIYLEVTGVTEPVMYSWTGPNGFSESTLIISNLEPGLYSMQLEDANGCTGMFDVEVELIADTEPPQLIVPQDITVNTDPGHCGATVHYAPPEGSDNCAFSISQTDLTGLSSGSFFYPGTTILEYQAEDESGNITAASFSITVIDSEPPTVLVQDIEVILDENGFAEIQAETLDMGSTDACGIAYFSVDQNSFGCENVGLNSVGFSATDIYGNEATQFIAVNVIDATEPIVMTNNIRLELDENGFASIQPEDIDAGSSDACGLESMSLDIQDFDCSHLGPNTVTLMVTDIHGNTAQGLAEVFITDVSPPVPLVNILTLQLGEDGTTELTIEDLDDGSYDNCGIEYMGVDISTFDCSHVGFTTVQFTVIDHSGNETSIPVDVYIEDITPPEVLVKDLVIPLDDNGMASISPEDLDNGSSDACGIESMVLSVADFTCEDIGPVPVSLYVSDHSGNVSSGSAMLTIVDQTDPLVLLKDIHIQLDENGLVSISGEDLDNGSFDACGIASIVPDKTQFGCPDVGANSVSVVLTDNNGNSSSGTAKVYIEDVTPPTVLTKQLNIFLDATGTATITPEQIDNGSWDACGIRTMSLDRTNFSCEDIGYTTVSLTVEDNHGNIETATESIVIIKIPPFIENLTISKTPQKINTPISASAQCNDPGFISATWDWGDGTLEEADISGSNINGEHVYSNPGLYIIKLIAYDVCGGVDVASYRYTIIYDPDAGFATGGGWFYSHMGSYVPDPNVSGRAYFGFVSKYHKNKDVPKGHAILKICENNLTFKATSLDWLVIDGNQAFLKGRGKINGKGKYEFMLSAIDGGHFWENKFDKIRFRIWEKDNESAIIYDSDLDLAIHEEPTNPLLGGAIIIHKPSWWKKMGSFMDEENFIKSFEGMNESIQATELEANLKVFPNPFADYLQVEFSGQKQDNVHVQIFNGGNGILVFNKEFRSVEGTLTINLQEQELPPGLYIIRIISDSGYHESARIMKIK